MATASRSRSTSRPCKRSRQTSSRPSTTRWRQPTSEASSIELEITESLLFNPECVSVRTFLDACRARNIDLVVDDFGIGYSSLGSLARLPIAKVKIDRSFVSYIGGGVDELLLSAMIDLGIKLDKRVVAEGVETVEQCRFLRAAGHLEGQGFHFLAPQPPEALAEWLAGASAAPGSAC